ncbi:MAG: hypothetical protein Q4C95_01900 [Planctomycetia bacterium]|nr:hypothetical protein [Planctomycetia bacterium]
MKQISKRQIAILAFGAFLHSNSMLLKVDCWKNKPANNEQKTEFATCCPDDFDPGRLLLFQRSVSEINGINPNCR